MPEDVEQKLRSLDPAALGMAHIIQSKYKGEDLTNKSILAFRQGGIGDMLFLLPVLQYIKRKYPTCRISVATGSKDPLINIPEISELHDMPFDSSLLNKHDYFIFFQGIIESGSNESKQTHAVDIFFKAFGLDPDTIDPKDKVARLHFSQNEYEWLDKTLAVHGIDKDKILIGIQMETSSLVRNYPTGQFKAVIDTLAKEDNVTIILIGNTPQQKTIGAFYRSTHKNVIVACDYTVRQHIILANRYNLVISPDSFMVQVAGSLNKPLVGLYGPFASDLRMRYFKYAIGLESVTPCTPCHVHGNSACIKGYPSPCFAQLTPDAILWAISKLYSRITSSELQFDKTLAQESVHAYY
jgi:ADP-heptose:LPS heptosyltransferase